MIKNRESAQLSRQRKKQYVGDLENKVKALSTETEQLRQQVIDLSSKNKHLQEEVAMLQAYIKENVPENTNSKNVKHSAAAGVCLLIILLSFGIFFDARSIQPFTAPEVAISHPSVYIGRTLNELPTIEVMEDEPEAINNLLGKRAYVEEHPEDIVSLPAKKQKVNNELVGPTSTQGYYPIVRASTNEPVYEEPMYGLSVIESPPQVVLPTEIPSEIKTTNSSFIYCSEAHQLSTSGTIYESREDFNPTITFLLPPAALNNSIPFIDEYLQEHESSLIELTCQITNIAVYPTYADLERFSTSLLDS